MKTIYLHLGYHKTATTFLQHSIYPNMKHVHYIPKKSTLKECRRIRLKRKLSDSEIGELREYFHRFDHGPPMLISNESLSGSPFAPRKTKRPLKILRDLRRIFPAAEYDAHVIIGIRGQVDLLTSLYIQHLHQGGVLNGRDYIKYCEHNGSIENFHFHRYLQQIEDVFGNGRLYVMVYEHFKHNPSEELLKLLNFMGEPEIPQYKNKERNKSYGRLQAAIARRLNRLFKTPIHPEGRLPVMRPLLPPRLLLQNKVSYALHYKKYELPHELQAALKRKYAEGNQQLAEKYKLNLPDIYLRES